MSYAQRMLFDADQAEELKQEGISAAAKTQRALLKEARDIAKAIATIKPKISADDVQRELIRRGHDPADLGNAAGAIFKANCWRPVGFKKSRRVSNHSRVIRVWSLN